MMGTGAFIYAANYSEYGLAGSGVLGPGAFVFYLLFKVSLEVRNRCKTGRWRDPNGSAWFL